MTFAPTLFCFVFNIKRVMAVGTDIIDARGNMIALCLQHFREVKLERGLITAHDEQVRKTRGMNA